MEPAQKNSPEDINADRHQPREDIAGIYAGHSIPVDVDFKYGHYHDDGSHTNFHHS